MIAEVAQLMSLFGLVRSQRSANRGGQRGPQGKQRLATVSREEPSPAQQAQRTAGSAHALVSRQRAHGMRALDELRCGMTLGTAVAAAVAAVSRWLPLQLADRVTVLHTDSQSLADLQRLAATWVSQPHWIQPLGVLTSS